MEKTKEIRPHSPYSSPADATKEGVGRNSGCPSPSAPTFSASSLCCLSPMLPLPEFTLRRLTLDVFPSRGWDLPPHICGGEEAQYRLVAPRIGEEVPDVGPVLASPCLPPHLCPQNFLLAFPVRAALKEMFPCLGPVRAPPVSGCVLVSRPLQVLTG